MHVRRKVPYMRAKVVDVEGAARWRGVSELGVDRCIKYDGIRAIKVRIDRAARLAKAKLRG